MKEGTSLISEGQLLAAARQIAESSISREAPDELPYFSALWGYVTSARPARFDRHRPEMRRWIGGLQTLSFADKKLVSAHSVVIMVSVLETLKELNAEVLLPDEADLERGIASMAMEIRASGPRARSLAKSLAPELLRQWIELQEKTKGQEIRSDGGHVVVSIDASGDVRKHDGKPLGLGRRPRELLSQLVREKEVCWWEGYVIFERWPRRRITNPPHQFSVDCSRLKKILGKIQPGLCAVREGGTRLSQGAWHLVVPQQVVLCGEIVEARGETEEALRDFENASCDRAQKKASAALKKDPGSYKAMEVFLNATDSIPGSRVPDAQLRDLTLRIARLVGRLENAANVIDNLMVDTPPFIPAEDLDTTRQQIGLRWSSVQSLRQSLDARLHGLPPPPADVSTFYRVVDLIRQYRRSEGEFQERAFDELRSIEAVCQAVAGAAGEVMQCLKVHGAQRHQGMITSEQEEPRGDEESAPHDGMEPSVIGMTDQYEGELTPDDVANTVVAQMITAFSKGFEPIEYDSLGESMSALKKRLVRKSVEELVGIDPKVQADVRRMRAFTVKHAPDRRDPMDCLRRGSLCKGWDKDRWLEAVKNEHDLVRKVDVPAYYRIFPPRRGGAG